MRTFLQKCSSMPMIIFPGSSSQNLQREAGALQGRRAAHAQGASPHGARPVEKTLLFSKALSRQPSTVPWATWLHRPLRKLLSGCRPCKCHCCCKPETNRSTAFDRLNPKPLCACTQVLEMEVASIMKGNFQHFMQKARISRRDLRSLGAFSVTRCLHAAPAV